MTYLGKGSDAILGPHHKVMMDVVITRTPNFNNDLLKRVPIT